VGLGNLVYPNTRHSVGISFVERLAKRLGALSGHFFNLYYLCIIFKIIIKKYKLTATRQT